MKGYHEMMLDIATQLVQKWQRTGRDEEIEVAEDMTKLTLDTIGLCGFDFRFNSFYKENQHPFIESMLNGLNEAMDQASRLPVADKLMIKRRKEFEQDVEFMKQLVDDIIQERKNKIKRAMIYFLSCYMQRILKQVNACQMKISVIKSLPS